MVRISGVDIVKLRKCLISVMIDGHDLSLAFRSTLISLCSALDYSSVTESWLTLWY